MKYVKTLLANGSSLVLLQIPESSSITVSAHIKAGFRFDPPDNPGLAHFVEHMLFTGTSSYPSHDSFAFEVERHGGWHMAFTWIDHQHHYVHFPRDTFPFAVRVLMESLFCSRLDVRELDKEKGVVKEEILRNMADPEKTIWNYTWLPLFFQNTPLERPYTGTRESVTRFTKEAVKSFVRSYVRNGEIVFLVSGDIAIEKTQREFNRYINLYKNFSKIDTPVIQKKTLTRVRVKEQKTTLTSLMVGIPTVDFASSDRHILNLLVNSLSRGFGGSLVTQLRNDGGLTYTLSGYQDNLLDCGYLTFKTATHSKYVKKVIRIILQEFQRLAKGNITKQEIEAARDHLIGRLYAGMETGFDYVSWYGLQELLTPNHVIHVINQVDLYKKITREDVINTAQKYFSRDAVYIAACGDIKQKEIEKTLTQV